MSLLKARSHYPARRRPAQEPVPCRNSSRRNSQWRPWWSRRQLQGHPAREDFWRP
ncbi:unnamed protein product, partial [Nesidiocoris tenuis]